MPAVTGVWGPNVWGANVWGAGVWQSHTTPTPTVTIVYTHGTASPGESEVSICNLALSHLGVSKAIIALDERSTEARACNMWYARCRDEVLSGFPWPFAVTTATLALVAIQPTSEWGYAYTYPSESLTLLREPGGIRNPSLEQIIPYRITRNGMGGALIYTDEPNATIDYVARVTDPEEFPPDFVVSLSYLIASRICATVTAENRKENTTLMLQLHKQTLAGAMASVTNEESPTLQPESGLISSRN